MRASIPSVGYDRARLLPGPKSEKCQLSALLSNLSLHSDSWKRLCFRTRSQTSGCRDQGPPLGEAPWLQVSTVQMRPALPVRPAGTAKAQRSKRQPFPLEDLVLRAGAPLGRLLSATCGGSDELKLGLPRPNLWKQHRPICLLGEKRLRIRSEARSLSQLPGSFHRRHPKPSTAGSGLERHS